MISMDMRAVAYEVGGARIGVLPDIISATVTVPRNGTPTVSMTYPQGNIGVRGDLLSREVEVGFELAYNNDWQEIPGGRFVSQKSSDSPLFEETGSKSFQAVHITRYLQEALVWEIPASEKDSDGKWNFKSSTAGLILKTLWDRAVSRGWGKGLSLNVSVSHDSAGQAWANIVTLAFGVSISIQQVVDTLENLGMIDYQWQGRTLNVYNADSHLARNLNLPWPLAKGTSGAPESTSWDNLCTDVLVQGENGASWRIHNNEAPRDLRRIEKVVEAGGVSLETTARLVARSALLEGAAASEEVVREWDGIDSVVYPFRDYRIGDWLSVQRAGSWDRLRVVQVSITKDEKGVSGHTTFGTRLDDMLSRLAKKTKGIVGGAAIAGNTVRPAPERGKARKPGVPQGLVASGDVVKDARGFDVGVVAASWVRVGENADGTVGEPDTYEMRVRTAPDGGKAAGPYLVWPAAELNQGYVDNLDPGKLYQVGVRSLAEGVPSDWSNNVDVRIPKDALPPPVPQAPTAKNVLGVLVANWSGVGVNNAGMPTDFLGIEYGVAVPNGQLEVKARGEGLAAREQRIPGLTVGEWDVALRSYDRDGNLSAWSQRTRVRIQSNVDADAIRKSLDEVLPEVEGKVLSQAQRMQNALAALAARGILAGEVPPDEGTVGKTLWVGPDGKVWRLKRKGA